jgi:putative sterol carrier protein
MTESAATSPAAPGFDPAQSDLQQLARTIGETPDAQLREGMRSEFRGAILDEVFRRFPEHIDPARTKGVSARTRWKVTGRDDGDADRFAVIFENGACRAERDSGERPRVTFEIDGADLLKLVTGNANPMVLVGTGRLRVKGDLLFAARIANFFTIPAPAPE